MKLLLYGFQPFGKYSTNISESIIYSLPKFSHVTTHIFPTKFDSQQLTDVANQLNPSHILGLGQYPRGNKLRIERRAINQIRSSKLDTPTPIEPNLPLYQQLNWHLKPNQHSWISYHPGKYVCNFSMYHLCKWSQSHQSKFAFIHIPIKTNLNQTQKFIVNQINKLN